MADLQHQLRTQHAAVELAAGAIAEAFMTQRGQAGLLRQQVCSCDAGDLRLTLLAPGLLFVTENLLLLLENVQLGLVCFPLPHAGQRSEKLLQLTVCGRSLQLQFWSPRAVHKWLAAPMRAQVPVLPSPSAHATSTTASPAVHGNLALQGCQGCFQARQLESLADAVAQRIGDFAAALVSAADTELTSLRAAAGQDTTAAADSDSTIVSSNSSCAGSESLRQRQRQADTGTEASECREDAGMHGVGSMAAAPAMGPPSAAAQRQLSSPFGHLASGCVSPTSPGALADSDASRRGSGDDAGMLLFGDDNFAGSAIRARRKLSAALTASPRSRDRSPRLSSSLPTNSTLTPLRRTPEQESSHYASVDSSARHPSRSSGDSWRGPAAAMSPLGEVSHQQLQAQGSTHLSSMATQAGNAEQDLSSSQRLSLQSFLQSQLELSHPDKAEQAVPAAERQQQAQHRPQQQQQQQQQVSADLPQLQPVEQDEVAEPAAAEASRQPSAASQSPGITSAAMAEAAASALEAAASALRAGAAASTAAAECLPPTGTIVQAGAAAGAAVGAVAVLAAAAPAIAPAATETVKSAIGDAATTVVTAAAETAKVAVEAAADAAVEAGSNLTAAAAGPAAEGAAAATCTVAEAAAETAGPAAAPLAQGAADAVCVAAEAAADAVVPAAASGPAAALVGAAGAAAAGLAGLAIQEQPAGPASSGDMAASPGEAASAGSDASAKQQRALSSETPPSLSGPPLEALRGGDCSSSTTDESQLPGFGLEARVQRATSSQLTAKLGRANPFSSESSREKCAVYGTDETACCGAADTGSCKCWQSLSAPWIAFRSRAADRFTISWQPSSQLQADAAICVAVLLACLGACLAPQLLGVAAVTQLAPHAALVACLAAAPPLLMLACSHWYLDHREAVLSSAAIAALAVVLGAAATHLRSMAISRLKCWYSASCSAADLAQ